MNITNLSDGKRSARTAGQAATLAAAWIGLAALAGCATTPPPTDQLAVSTAALTHATNAGSGEYAPLEMSLAQDKLGRARTALAAKDNGTALALAQQAQLDAQLAESKAESIKARKSAEALQDAARALREEMGRKAP